MPRRPFGKMNKDISLLFLVVVYLLHDMDTSEGLRDDRERHVIYSTGNWELRVRSITERMNPPKTFKIQTEKTRGGVAVNYRGDEIFFADGRNIYRIYLVDEQGKRKKSNRGELFFYKDANHVEVFFYTARKDIAGIFYDTDTSKLYAAADTDLFELNSTTSDVITSLYVGYHRNVRNPFIFDKTVYVFMHSETYYGYPQYTVGIYRNKDRTFSPIVRGHGEKMTRFSIDSVTGKLYYHMRSTIRMVPLTNGNGTMRPAVPIERANIVLGNSNYTLGVEAVAVHRKYVIWSSNHFKKLFFGVMDERSNFILARNIEVFDDGPVSSQHLAVFVKDDGEKPKDGDVNELR